jgi:E3 ubiquitin-protein ligase MARCH6
MPLAVKLFKPSDALHAMYTWWFRKCAHLLRLTWFMFDERRKDEEGYYRHWKWSRLFASQDVASKDGQGTDTNEKSAPDPFTDTDFQRDGRYVRAPASDQVRIPKGDKIFMTVDENNKRIDHELDRPDGIHGSENTQYKHLYIPPWFRLRIFSFILSIWVFAAVTGVSVTIIPLILGRYVFARFIPPHVRKNDIYAFSIGVYILGSILYAAFHVRNFYQTMKSGMFSAAAKPRLALRRLLPVLSRITRVLWTYTAFLVVLPILFSTVVELYLILPLHSYMALQERHVIHFVQNWTLGLLYVKLTTRFILWHAESRQAISLRAITRNGYLNPDAILATRCFILPLGLVLTTALIVPYGLATSFLSTIFKHRPDGHVLVYRYTYPLTMCAVVVGFALYSLWGMVKQWQLAIRDEVYLIGERLHNYGERKSSQAGLQGGPNMRRVETGA